MTGQQSVLRVAGSKRGVAGGSVLALLAALVTVVSAPAEATDHPRMYAVDGAAADEGQPRVGAETSLYTVDVATGAATAVGPTGFTHLVGLDADPITGTLYGHANGQSTGSDVVGAELVTIDRLVGTATSVGPTDLVVPDMAFAEDGTLFAWDERAGHPDATSDDNLWTIDAGTGTASEIGDAGVTTNRTGLAFAPDGTLWMKADERFHTVDTITGLASIEFTADQDLHNALTFAPDGTAYTIVRDTLADTTILYTVDLETGVVDEVGDMGVPWISSIAFFDGPPTAIDDDANVERNGSVVIDVTANDLDDGASALTVEVVDGPTMGAAIVTAAGVEYTHTAGTAGTDSLTYRLSDEAGPATDLATVTVEVTNAAPIAADDVAGVARGGSVTVDVLANDSDPDSVDLGVAIVTPPAVGSASVEDGQVVYAHDGSTGDEVTFEYEVTDEAGEGPDSVATVTVAVDGVIGTVLGGEAVIGADVFAELGGLTNGAGPFRLFGINRYETAAAISADTFAPGVPVAFVAAANGERLFADALSGGPLAGRLGAPVLLVSSTLPEATATELERLQPDRIVVLGGNAVVSDQVEAELAEYTTGGVDRLFGTDRYGTAAAVAGEFAPGVTDVFVATGLNFPDALAAGPAAITANGPILLVTTDSIPAATGAQLERLDPGRITIVGGEAVVDATVAAALADFTDGEVRRYGGQTRYETATIISAEEFAGGATHLYLATGRDFPDALAGVPAAGLASAPILLGTVDSLPTQTTDEIGRLEGLS